MAVELLEAVRAAEEKAEAIRRDAAEQAREIVKAVEEATLESSRQGAVEIRAAYQERMNDHQRAAQERIAAQASQRQKALDALAAQARKNIPQAAALIAERIVRHGDH